MPGVYVDTSALGRVLLAEPDAVPIRTALAGYDAWWASELLVVEFRRLAYREGLTQAAESLMRALRSRPALQRTTAGPHDCGSPCYRAR
jgi:hypothetical protein